MDSDASSVKDSYDVEVDDAAVDGLASTRADRADMHRLGRKQELKRSFRQLSMLSFTVIVQATWEFVLWCVFPCQENDILTAVQLPHARPPGRRAGRARVELRLDCYRLRAHRP
jgi:hypothetical protein